MARHGYRCAVAAQRELATALFDQLRRDGLDEPGVSRDPYGPGEQRAHATVTATAQQLGLRIEHDAAANLYMTLPGHDPHGEARHRRLASRFGAARRQFRRRGGRGGRACRRRRAAALGITLDCDLTVMGIRAEESIWFQVSYIGSRGALGTLPDRRAGCAPHRHRIARWPNTCRLRRRSRCAAWPCTRARSRAHRAYLELHIEQAPSLVEAGRPVAICTGIPGNFRYPDARIEGSHDHVGLPRRFRRDAAMAGAEFAMALDRMWEAHEAKGVPMACTIGRFHTDTATHGMTIVPAPFISASTCGPMTRRCSANSTGRWTRSSHGIEQRRGVRFHRGPKARAAVGQVDPEIRSAWRIAPLSWVSRCCISAARPRMTRPLSLPPACRWA